MSVAARRQGAGIRGEVAALKRERTIGAAVDLFYERGYENTTLDAVAERLGVTKPFIYANFSSKAELLAEICSRGIATSVAAMDSVKDLDASPTEKLDQLGRRFVTAVLSNQRAIAIFTREEKNLDPADYKRISDMRRDFDTKLNALLQAGIRSGEFRVSDRRVAALAIGGMVSWAYVWYRDDGRLSLSALSDEMSRVILAMVGVSSPAERQPASREPGPRRAVGSRAAPARTGRTG